MRQPDAGQRHREEEWMRVTKGEPCGVCGAPDWCSVCSNGARCCMRVKSHKAMKNGGWLHMPSDTDLATTKPFVARPKERRKTDQELTRQFGPLAREWYIGKDAEMAELAVKLGVAAWALDAIYVGFDSHCYTFPETNEHGLVVGVNRRFPDGSKRCVLGSRRGLTFAEEWADAPGPVLIVEGASDVAAGLTMGLNVVGRPSNTGGVEYLTRLLGRFKRKITIIAERDEKDRSTLDRHDPKCQCCGQCWPGRFGAIETSLRLTKNLKRIVDWTLLPDQAKDLRGWMVSRSAKPLQTAEAREALGVSLLRRIQRKISK